MTKGKGFRHRVLVVVPRTAGRPAWRILAGGVAVVGSAGSCCSCLLAALFVLV